MHHACVNEAVLQVAIDMRQHSQAGHTQMIRRDCDGFRIHEDHAALIGAVAEDVRTSEVTQPDS